MVKCLGGAYSRADVTTLFYPEGDHDNGGDGGGGRRRHGFLQALEDSEYAFLHEELYTGNRPRFLDIEAPLRTRKEDGRVMKRVMEHVVRWVNARPHEVMDSREGTKPLLREDLKPALRRNAIQSDHGYGGRARRFVGSDEDHGDEEEEAEVRAEADSIRLERLVLTIVRDQMDLFRDPMIAATLEAFPKEAKEQYAARFAHEPWGELLRVVRGVFATRFEPVWDDRAVPTAEGSGGQHEQRTKISAIAGSLKALARTIPEVRLNPALNGKEATQDLFRALEDAVSAWVTRQYDGASEEDDENSPVLLAAADSDAHGPALRPRRTTNEQQTPGRDRLDGAAEAEGESVEAGRQRLQSPAQQQQSPAQQQQQQSAEGRVGQEIERHTASRQNINSRRQARVALAPQRAIPLSPERPRRAIPVTDKDYTQGQGPSRRQQRHKQDNKHLPSINSFLSLDSSSIRRWHGPVAQ